MANKIARQFPLTFSLSTLSITTSGTIVKTKLTQPVDIIKNLLTLDFSLRRWYTLFTVMRVSSRKVGAFTFKPLS
jgi:hypothetical protein